MAKETGITPFSFPLSLSFILLFLLLLFLSLYVSLGNRAQAHQISLLLAGTCSIFVRLHWWGYVLSQSIVLGSIITGATKFHLFYPFPTFLRVCQCSSLKGTTFLLSYLYTLIFLVHGKNFANYTLFFLP